MTGKSWPEVTLSCEARVWTSCLRAVLILNPWRVPAAFQAEINIYVLHKLPFSGFQHIHKLIDKLVKDSGEK